MSNICRTANTTTNFACLFQCSVASESNWTCPPPILPNGAHSGQSGHGHKTTLAIYAALRLVSTTVMWLAVPLLDAVAVSMAKQYNGELGRQKMFSQLGFCTMPLVAGALIAKASEMKWLPRLWYLAFYVFAIMHGIAAIMIFTTKVDARLPAVNLGRTIKKLMGDELAG